uniref:Uncharacterized protein n=1 Tax=Oryza barthii TaxID=65489 RepID=A0A0D3ERH4_9ORYZ
MAEPAAGDAVARSRTASQVAAGIAQGERPQGQNLGAEEMASGECENGLLLCYCLLRLSPIFRLLPVLLPPPC